MAIIVRIGRAAVVCALALALVAPTLSAAAAPANDNLGGAKVLSGQHIRVNGTTLAATRQAAEPDHYTNPNYSDNGFWLGDHSVWYRWTAPASGRVIIDTCLGSIDSILAVYTGNRLDTLTRVVDNNNHEGCKGTWGSLVTFRAQKGTTYRIAVADCGGAREGAFTLRLHMR
jgi:hypothetical protein